MLAGFFLIYKCETQFFSGCPPEKTLGRFYRVDFTGYPSNQFSRYRLNGRLRVNLTIVDLLTLCFSEKLPAASNSAFTFRGHMTLNEMRAGLTTV